MFAASEKSVDGLPSVLVKSGFAMFPLSLGELVEGILYESASRLYPALSVLISLTSARKS